jgi:hypothetical protein
MNHPIFATQAEDFLATTLCLWRLTHLIGVEEGPFRLIARLRGRATAFSADCSIVSIA